MKYDAARTAFDEGTTSARKLREACSAPDQQDRANKAISRYTDMQANNEKMILRLRGACAARRVRDTLPITILPYHGASFDLWVQG